MSEGAADFMLRAVEEGDHAFIFHSFLKSFRDAPPSVAIPNSFYYTGQHAVIERLLTHPRAVALVACSREDPSQIYGYTLAQILDSASVAFHWLYVKHPFRNFGIGKTLEAAVVHDRPNVFFTHRARFLNSRPTYVFNPYILQERP